jgi:8-hydroxy-5-deazaflavin:NADPH oxidoreductase
LDSSLKHKCAVRFTFTARACAAFSDKRRNEYSRPNQRAKGSLVKIVVVGRGSVGGGLARLWQSAGHGVVSLGREGGDGSDADVVVVAVPSDAIPEALAKVTGLAGKITIDTTNSFSGPHKGFPSLAAEVKSIIGGPTAKSFSTNFAVLYDQIAAQGHRPSNVFAADADARDLTEQLIRDAGFEPVYAGDLDNARTVEDHIAYTMMLARSEIGPHFYRLAPPGEL